MSSDESDIEIKSALDKKSKSKIPRSPSVDLLKNDDSKKLTAKVMIRAALTDLKTPHSRKGVSIQAIKKYLHDKYNYDVERYNYVIKKYLKSAVESGAILQTKGIGASGSFRLVNAKEKTEKKKKMTKAVKDKEAKKEKMEEKRKKLIKPKKDMEHDSKPKMDKKTKKQKEPKKEIPKIAKPEPAKAKITKKPKPVIEKTDKPKKEEINQDKNKKEKSKKILKDHKTPAKKRAAMMKRKSIGSIIKPPKMKPKATKAK